MDYFKRFGVRVPPTYRVNQPVPPPPPPPPPPKYSFLQYPQSNAYYRLERGFWWTPGVNLAYIPPQGLDGIESNKELAFAPLNTYNPDRSKLLDYGYKLAPYIYPVGAKEVFTTFCLSNIEGARNIPTRLVLNGLTEADVDLWIGYHAIPHNSPVTIVKIFTDPNRRLPLAEDYISDVTYGKQYEKRGCPPIAMGHQLVRAREYVIQPSDVQHIEMEHVIIP